MSDKLDRKESFKKFEDEKLCAKVPLSWKESFSQRVVIPHKMRNCTNCQKYFLCDRCDKLKNQTEDLLANLNEIK